MVRLPAAVADALADFGRRLRARFPGRVRSLRLFGSYARGSARPESDVDLLVVIEALGGGERRDVFDLAEDVYFDRLVRLAPLALSDAEWDELRGRELLIAADIEREGVEL